MVKIHAIAGNSPITFADTIIQQQNIEVAGHITASGNLEVVGDISGSSTSNLIVGGDIEAKGNITAKQLIVSSSTTYMTTSFSTGNTEFGDSLDDLHRFTGSLLVTGSLISGASTTTGSFA